VNMLLESRTTVIVNLAVLFFGSLGVALAQVSPANRKPTWLWVMDENTNIGIEGASVDLRKENETDWTAHFITGRAGRVLVNRPFPNCLPDGGVSCRVTLNGRELPVMSGSMELEVPYRGRADKVLRTVIYVSTGGPTDQEGGDWSSNSPTLFRAYIQDKEARRLLDGVEIKAVHSGITTRSDSDGLFTIEIPASFRLGKSPSLATETLVFVKPGYETLEYRQLVLQPGLTTLEVLLQKRAGALIRINRSLTNRGNPLEDEYIESPGRALHIPEGYPGKIISLEVSPSTYDGWTLFKKGAKAIVKSHNLANLEIFWVPTGTGVTSSVAGGKMKKVRSSPQEDTWELQLSDEIMSTSFWAQGTDKEHATVRSIDLGNVGYDDRP
jgi:hypothetical protein